MQLHEEVIKKEWSFIGDSSDDPTLKCHDGAVEETGGDLQEWAWRRRAGQQEEQGAERAAEAGQNGYARMHCTAQQCVKRNGQRGDLLFYKWSLAKAPHCLVNVLVTDPNAEMYCK